MSAASILLFLVILLVLVIVHEFGHFITAKLVNMRVDEFAFGFPPRIFAKKKGETTYAINSLPLGGYVSIWGENGEPDDKAKDHPRAFSNRPKWAQLLVLVAGVAMNMLLALFIFIGTSFGTVQMPVDDPTYGARVKDEVLTIVDAAPNSPAFKAGLVPGTVLTKITSGGQAADLSSATSAVSFIERHQNDSFTINYITPDGIQESTVVAAVYGIVPDRKALGISLSMFGTIKTTPIEAVKLGWDSTVVMTEATLSGLWSLVTSIGEGKDVLTSLTGPIGIANVVGQTSNYGWVAILSLVAILSINLAIFNLLPIPALDGGRIVVVLLEAISRKRIPFKYYSWANIIGFAALMILVIVVSVNDVVNLVHNYHI